MKSIHKIKLTHTQAILAIVGALAIGFLIGNMTLVATRADTSGPSQLTIPFSVGDTGTVTIIEKTIDSSGDTSQTSYDLSSFLIDKGLYRLSSVSPTKNGISLVIERDSIPQRIGAVGCSQTRDAMQGFERLGATNKWDQAIFKNYYSGGTLDVWGSGDGTKWSAFDLGMSMHPDTDAIWWEFCIKDRTSTNLTSQDKQWINFIASEVQSRAPGVPIYVSAMNDYEDGMTCSITGPEGPTVAQAAADYAVANGLARRGPVISDLTRDMVKSDGCHANDIGKELWGHDLIDFFNSGVSTESSPTNQPPSITLTAPAEGDVFTDPAGILITADASDSDGSVVEVEFYIDGSLQKQVTNAPYEFNWNNVSAGTYSISAIAYDDDGATASSNVVSVSVQSSTDDGDDDSGSGSDPDGSTGDLSSGLIGHWTLEDTNLNQTVGDSSGNGDHGTLHGQANAQVVTGVDGGQAIDLDGRDDYIQTTSSGVAGTSARSISAWFKTTSNERGDDMLVTWGSDHAGTEGSTYRLSVEMGVITLRVYGGATKWGSEFNDGNWHHVVLTTPDGGALADSQVYVDGVDLGTGSGSAVINTSAGGGKYSDVRIGQDAQSNRSRYFNGQVDNVRIYDRVLNSSEVDQLFQSNL